MNFFSDELRRDPFAAYDRARISSPVLPIPSLGLWMIFEYEEVKRAMTDHEAFSSSMAKANRPNPPWLVFFDPPRHSKLRALIARAFTPGMVASLEARIRQLSDEVLDQNVERGEMDIVAEFAAPLPVMVIAQMLGIPDAEWRDFRRWSDVIVTSSSLAVTGGEQWKATAAEAAAVGSEMKSSLREWIAERRSAPKDDLLTALTYAEIDGDRLSEEEIFGFLQLLLVAGTETSAALIGNAILCLAEHPDQMARLREAPELLPSAIEEVLRYRSPLQWMLRVTARDVRVKGRFIPAGELVLAMIGSANRDPRQFPEPSRFDIGRNPNPHIAFGHGIHFCLGAPLARMEARVALSAFFDRVDSLELGGQGQWEPHKALHLHGPGKLPVRFQPRARATHGNAG